MFLTSTNLVHYLVASGYRSRADVVHAPLAIGEIDGLHRSFRVAGDPGKGLFVKQLKSTDPLSIASLQREASCYRLAWSDSSLSDWQRLLPRLVAYDPDRHVVVVQLIDDAEDWIQYHRRVGAFPGELGDLLGTGLGEFHASSAGLVRGSETGIEHDAPWIFQFHVRDHDNDSPAIRELARRVRQDASLSRQLAGLAERWLPASLIHGDLKWSNCLVSPNSDGTPRLHLADWELAGWGDRLWDVAGGMAGYLSEPLLSRDLYVEEGIQESWAAEGETGAAAAMRRVWDGYGRSARLDPDAATANAAHCLQFVGARLLLTIVEHHQHAERLEPRFGPLLETAQWLLGETPAAVARLLAGDR